jgi:hypothetical protein
VSAALVEEAIKKAALVWVSVGDGPALGLWCMPLDGALIIVSGPGEQQAPGLAAADRASVRMRGDTGGLIVIWDAVVERLLPGGEAWEAAAQPLAGKRLNATGTAEDLVARWVETGCALVRLTPAPEQPVARPDLPDVSSAAEPRDTPARNATRRPFKLHRVRRR